MKLKELFKKREKNVTLNLGPNPTISKEVLDKLAEKLPKDVRPTIVQTEGEITYVQEDGKVVRLSVPLLNIVPIPRIKIEDVDTSFFDASDYNGLENNQVVVDIPSLNITPIPNIKIEDIDLDFHKKIKE